MYDFEMKMNWYVFQYLVNSKKYMTFISLNDFTFDPEVNNLKLVMKQWTTEFKGKTQYNKLASFKNITDSNDNNKIQLESIYINIFNYYEISKTKIILLYR